jgi:hypothetical protein
VDKKMSSNFNTKIGVKVVNPATGEEYPIIPIISVTPNISTPKSHEHSLEADMVGKTRGPSEFSFTITCKASKDEIDPLKNPAKWLSLLQLKEIEFDIVFGEVYSEGAPSQQWAFADFSLNKCMITNGSPSNLVLNGSPVATFNGICSEVNMDGEVFDGFFNLP